MFIINLLYSIVLLLYRILIFQQVMDPISDSSVYSKIPTLSTELQNYASWQWATASLFHTKKCSKIIDGTELRPAVPANNAAAAVRTRVREEQDERAAEGMLIIQRSIAGDPV
jgi:hypothetical protein